MTQWVRFQGAQHQDGAKSGFGALDGNIITVHTGDVFAEPTPTGETRTLADVTLATPCEPGQVLALWNNSRAIAEKQGLSQPDDPLFFLKAPGSWLAPGGVIRKPANYDGRVIYEAELGVVIGKNCTAVTPDDAAAAIFGYTCVNDVTALQTLDLDPTFPQWARAKGYDTFCPFGPAIVTGADLTGATVRATLNGRERQNYPLTDLFLQPAEIVSKLSHMVTLQPGDLIACGTGPGALPMKPGATIDITIDNIGTLSNTYEV